MQFCLDMKHAISNIKEGYQSIPRYLIAPTADIIVLITTSRVEKNTMSIGMILYIVFHLLEIGSVDAAISVLRSVVSRISRSVTLEIRELMIYFKKNTIGELVGVCTDIKKHRAEVIKTLCEPNTQFPEYYHCAFDYSYNLEKNRLTQAMYPKQRGNKSDIKGVKKPNQKISKDVVQIDLETMMKNDNPGFWGFAFRRISTKTTDYFSVGTKMCSHARTEIGN